MILNFEPVSIAFFIGVAIALYFAHTIWMRRKTPGAAPFTIFMLSVSAWLLVRTIEAGAIDFTAKVVCAEILVAVTASASVMWLSFTLDYTGSRWWRRPLNLVLLFFIPVVILVVVSLSQGYGSPLVHPALGTGGQLISWEHKPLFWILGLYLGLLLLTGFIILWRFIIKKSGVYRRQILTLFCGTLVAVAGIVINALGFNPVKGFDIIPLTFLIAAIIYGVTIFRFRFLDVVPVARGRLVESMPDGILVLNAERMIADMNPAAGRMMGREGGTAVGMRLEQVWPKLDLLRAGLEEGRHTELLSESKGNSLYLDMSVTSLRDSRGAIAGQLIVLRDITERRKMEQTLKESESRYAALVEQSNEGVLIIQDGVYKFVNRTMTEISGYTREELLGKSLPFGIAEEDQGMMNERYRQRLGGQEVPGVYGVRGKRKDGQTMELDISAGLITYEGKLADMVTIRDVTERKQNQRKLEALYEEERRLSRSLQEEIEKRAKYTRMLVHELNTPLTSILASGELLETEVADETLVALVKNIRRSSYNLKQRIDELIELARGETGILKIKALPLDLGQLLQEVLSEMSLVASGKGLMLISEIGELPLVNGDRDRLRQVMINLLSNAIKFTGKGVVAVRARYEGGETVLVEVQDTGRGIDKDQMEDLFDPYLRKVPEGQAFGGLGIGLALSKMLVNLHQGKIWAESNPGGGSIFRFTIPVYKE
jgi:PAS domain S-box-containing protein